MSGLSEELFQEGFKSKAVKRYVLNLSLKFWLLANLRSRKSQIILKYPKPKFKII